MMRSVLGVIVCISLCSCNALYYYDKEAVAINIEGRPDPSAPVQVAMGLKQRTTVVAPATCPDSDKNDVVSMISGFSAENKSDSSALAKTKIRASFASGVAATFTKDGVDPCSKMAITKSSVDSVKPSVQGLVGPNEKDVLLQPSTTTGLSDQNAELARKRANNLAVALLPAIEKNKKSDTAAPGTDAGAPGASD